MLISFQLDCKQSWVNEIPICSYNSPPPSNFKELQYSYKAMTFKILFLQIHWTDFYELHDKSSLGYKKSRLKWRTFFRQKTDNGLVCFLKQCVDKIASVKLVYYHQLFLMSDMSYVLGFFLIKYLQFCGPFPKSKILQNCYCV